MIIVGLGYAKQSGKDTVAKFIMDYFTGAKIPVLRRAFADALKEEVTGMVQEYFKLDYDKVLAEMYSDDPAVKGRWRLLLQWWGTEGWRHEDPEHWVRSLKLWIETKEAANKALADQTFLFVPDVRFHNEAEFIKSIGGLVILVDRPDLPQGDKHASENELANYGDWDAIMINDGTLADLERKSYEMYSYLRSWARCDE